MTRRGLNLFVSGMLVLASQAVSHGETATNSPNFNEVYNLIHANAPGVTDAELNRAAIDGLVSALSPKVSLITPGAEKSEGEPVSKVNMFDNIVYVRVARVSDGLAKAIGDAYRNASVTNRITGLILDLRYTDGTDYSAAAAAADLFTSKATPLLNWGTGAASSHQKTNAITEPVAILVNHDTAGASEALAAAMREVGAGLILGSRTAGRASDTKDFPLKNGQILRVATTPVALGDGSSMSQQGLKPDIDVTVSVQDEKSFYADAFLMKTNEITSLSSTNQPNGTNQASRRFHLNEAELVRARKQGIDLDAIEEGIIPAGESKPETPVVRDPALARALDLLKGLAVVRQSHS